MAAMQIRVERILAEAERGAGEKFAVAIREGRITFEKKRRPAGLRDSGAAWRFPCDKASPAGAVMLHLRACYVSKAAILTVPTPRVPVENRSPA